LALSLPHPSGRDPRPSPKSSSSVSQSAQEETFRDAVAASQSFSSRRFSCASFSFFFAFFSFFSSCATRMGW